MKPSTVQLNIQRAGDTCVFHLLWGQGQQCQVQIPYPTDLDRLYRDWQRAYHNFYRGLSPISPPEILRGKVVSSGAGTAANTDWQADLAELQQRLQLEFHRWLQHPDLQPIRQPIIKSAVAGHPVDLLIACPLDLARLPWERWELGTSVGIQHHIRIARTALNMTETPSPRRLQRPRILVILGDDQGLNFQREIAAIAPLRKKAEVHFIGWTPERSVRDLKDEIQTALIDKNGWDILFFAGHSNEKPTMGGEFSIAPNGWIQLDEIKPLLAIAKQNGLQFALFNSCRGLNIAESLMNIGLSQVVIMREPIHNSVAEAFFESFAQSLAHHHDVHDSLLAACQDLKTQKALTFPSADLIPSFFRRPHTDLFRIPKRRWQTWFRKLQPSKYEAIALLGLLILVWQMPVQKWLLERRVLAQALYRDLSHQSQPTEPPPILLIQIDEASLRDEERIRPIPRDYLARLLDRLAGAPVIGLDYLLDLPEENTPVLAQSLTHAAQQGSLIVLAASRDPNTHQWRYAQPDLIDPKWTMSGSMTVRGTLYAELLWRDPLPLSFLLASLHHQCIELDRQPCSLQAITQTYAESHQEPFRFRPSGLTRLSYQVGQMWFHPIIDYSLPPDWIYQPMSAQTILDNDSSTTNLSNQTIFIVPNYASAGVNHESEDNFPAPAAFRHWQESQRRILTGGEIHSYLLYQYLNNRMVIPIPDVWMMLPAIILGKGFVLLQFLFRLNRSQQLLGLSLGTLIYVGFCLQIYVSGLALLIPIITPTLIVWLITIPHVRNVEH